MTVPRDARRNEITRELVQRITRSRHFDDRTCTYNPPQRVVPQRVKKLLQELDEIRGSKP
jgi:hypothetical protein